MLLRTAGLAIVALLSLASAALADCPPVGGMGDVDAVGAPVKKAKDAVTFKLTTRAGNQTVRVPGASCVQHYTNAKGRSDAEVQTMYRVRLQFQGAQFIYLDAHELTAIILRGAAQTWIGIRSDHGKTDITIVEKAP